MTRKFNQSRHPIEVKERAIVGILSGKTPADVSRDTNVTSQSIRRWAKSYYRDGLIDEIVEKYALTSVVIPDWITE